MKPHFYLLQICVIVSLVSCVPINLTKRQTFDFNKYNQLIQQKFSVDQLIFQIRSTIVNSRGLPPDTDALLQRLKDQRDILDTKLDEIEDDPKDFNDDGFHDSTDEEGNKKVDEEEDKLKQD
jgi:hypothetical protein